MFIWAGIALFTTQSPLLTTLGKKPVENIVGKGENAGKQHFLLFPQCFLPNQLHESSFELLKKCCQQMLPKLDWSKILLFDVELNTHSNM